MNKEYNGKYKGLEVEAIHSTNILICKTGEVNSYRIEFYLGHGGSNKEKSWNHNKHIHDCCKSKVSWRHKVSCPGLNKEQDNKIIISESKEELLKKYFG